MAEKPKVTVMVIKVDLECEKCRKKIKKILGKIPEIQNQIFDEKANTVTISVISSCPEKIKAKICCKGGKSIKGIEIKPEEPKDPKPEKPKEKTPDKPKETVLSDRPKDPKPDKPKETVLSDKPKDPKPDDKPKDPVVEPPKPKPTPPPAKPEPCYEGYDGPCYGTPVACYEAYGRPVYDSWGGGYGYGYGCRRGCYDGRCDCPGEDSSSSCSVM